MRFWSVAMCVTLCSFSAKGHLEQAERDMRIATAVLPDTVGSTSIEYAFIACLIAIAAAGSMSAAGNALGNTLFVASNQMNAAPALNSKG